MVKSNRIFHAIICGLLLCLPWYETFSGLFLCIALIPLLLIEDYFLTNPSGNSGKALFLYASLSFLIWNIGTTWWITNASLAGACTAILINTFLFSIVFYLYHITRKIAGNTIGKIAFITYWVAFEYFYLNAEISWPWLNLGNGFAFDTQLVQWYEYTGTLGGTAWILIANLLIFELLKKNQYWKRPKGLIISLAPIVLVLLFPIVLSIFIYKSYQEKVNPVNIVVIQPNVDPYAKYIPPVTQCSNLFHLIDSTKISTASYFVAPEVAIEDDVWENSIGGSYSVSSIKKFMQQYPSSQFIYGSYTFKRFEENEPKTTTAQWMKSPGFYFDSYNSALQIDSGMVVQKYHKSKLVVGIEKMPYPKALVFLRKIVESFGGSYASHATQNYRGVLVSTDKKIKVAPVICYESIYGEFVSDYIKNGANVIFIITNDGWWGNTPGHRQHLAYARIRAIETRRSIARSANTGISAFINQRGDMLKSLEYGKKGTIECFLNANDDKTFYMQHGDYLGRIASIISGCIVLFTFFTLVLKRKKH